jgi:hypothetical protein
VQQTIYPAKRAISAEHAGSYTGLKLFCPYLYRAVEKWAWPTFFTARIGHHGVRAAAMSDLQTDIQSQLSGLDPDIDLLAVEQPGSEMLRLFIDHPDGVDLALCERVTHHLNHLRADYALEVSSPGEKYRPRRVSSTASENKESSQ